VLRVISSSGGCPAILHLRDDEDDDGDVICATGPEGRRGFYFKSNATPFPSDVYAAAVSSSSSRICGFLLLDVISFWRIIATTTATGSLNMTRYSPPMSTSSDRRLLVAERWKTGRLVLRGISSSGGCPAILHLRDDEDDDGDVICATSPGRRGFYFKSNATPFPSDVYTRHNFPALTFAPETM